MRLLCLPEYGDPTKDNEYSDPTKDNEYSDPIKDNEYSGVPQGTTKY